MFWGWIVVPHTVEHEPLVRHLMVEYVVHVCVLFCKYVDVFF